jgi:hypothetical protein
MKKKTSKRKTSIIKHSHMLVVCVACKIRLVHAKSAEGCKKCDLCGSTDIRLEPWK